MRAWTVDADDIRVAEDFDESLLHRTPEIDGFLARVEIDVTEPATVTAIITRESAEELDLHPGMSAAAIVKSTSVMIRR